MVDISLASYLPSRLAAPRDSWENPWKQSYYLHEVAEWHYNNSYCDGVRTNYSLSGGRRMLDLIDLAVFDYLTGE